MTIRGSTTLNNKLKNYLNPWEYAESRQVLDEALSKYSVEEVAEAIKVTTRQIRRWKLKITNPTRTKLALLRKIDTLVKQ